jgi:NAD-specific glutamate dehydrogenase
MIEKLSAAVKSITSQLGNMPSQAGGNPGVVITKEWAADAAGQVADALKGVLAALESEADGLFAHVLQGKGMLAEGMHDADPAVVLAKFGASMESSLDTVSTFWQNMASSVSSKGEAILLALQQSSQGVVAGELQTWLDRAVSEMHGVLRIVMSTRSDAIGVLDGIQPIQSVWQASSRAVIPGVEQILVERLTSVYSRMEKLLEHVDAFEDAFRGMLQDFTDNIATLLTSRQSKEVAAAVDKKFNSVQDGESSLMWRVRAAGREFSTSIQRAVVQVADTLHVKLDKSVVHEHDPMPGVVGPSYMPYGSFGSAARGARLAAAAAAAACVFMLAI